MFDREYEVLKVHNIQKSRKTDKSKKQKSKVKLFERDVDLKIRYDLIYSYYRLCQLYCRA